MYVKSSNRRKKVFVYLVLDCSFLAGADINAISSLCKLTVRSSLVCMYACVCMYVYVCEYV